jgi:hypothetical protein
VIDKPIREQLRHALRKFHDLGCRRLDDSFPVMVGKLVQPKPDDLLIEKRDGKDPHTAMGAARATWQLAEEGRVRMLKPS